MRKADIRAGLLLLGGVLFGVLAIVNRSGLSAVAAVILLVAAWRTYTNEQVIEARKGVT
jgi:hypothetical protein